MNLYLMRHANAGVSREIPNLDAKRGLVKEGKEQCMLMARVLSALKVQVDVIVSSPLKRALQTAQFVGTELGYEAKVEISPALRPRRRTTSLSRSLLDKYADREGVLVVGHNPNLFQFLGRLITGNGGAGVRMRKGSVARIDMDRHPPLLQWLIDPRMARCDLRQRGKELAPEDLAEVVRLFAQRPQLQLRAGPSRLHLQINPLRIDLAPPRAARRWRGPGSAPRPAAAAPRRAARSCAPRRECCAARGRPAAGGSCPGSAQWPKPPSAAPACTRKSPSSK